MSTQAPQRKGAAADEGMRAHGGPQLLLAALTEETAGDGVETSALARLWAAWKVVLAVWTRAARKNRGRRGEDARLGREETRQQEQRRREVAVG
ncbi:amino acid permease [Sesbania bispinosa]|nr:amino acid permease [Sesbania bispinosa]